VHVRIGLLVAGRRDITHLLQRILGAQLRSSLQQLSVPLVARLPIRTGHSACACRSQSQRRVAARAALVSTRNELAIGRRRTCKGQAVLDLLARIFLVARVVDRPMRKGCLSLLRPELADSHQRLLLGDLVTRHETRHLNLRVGGDTPYFVEIAFLIGFMQERHLDGDHTVTGSGQLSDALLHVTQDGRMHDRFQVRLGRSIDESPGAQLGAIDLPVGSGQIRAETSEYFLVSRVRVGAGVIQQPVRVAVCVLDRHPFLAEAFANPTFAAGDAACDTKNNVCLAHRQTPFDRLGRNSA
jgi:hypothetical protein